MLTGAGRMLLSLGMSITGDNTQLKPPPPAFLPTTHIHCKWRRHIRTQARHSCPQGDLGCSQKDENITMMGQCKASIRAMPQDYPGILMLNTALLLSIPYSIPIPFPIFTPTVHPHLHPLLTLAASAYWEAALPTSRLPSHSAQPHRSPSLLPWFPR